MTAKIIGTCPLCNGPVKTRNREVHCRCTEGFKRSPSKYDNMSDEELRRLCKERKDINLGAYDIEWSSRQLMISVLRIKDAVTANLLEESEHLKGGKPMFSLPCHCNKQGNALDVDGEHFGELICLEALQTLIGIDPEYGDKFTVHISFNPDDIPEDAMHFDGSFRLEGDGANPHVYVNGAWGQCNRWSLPDPEDADYDDTIHPSLEKRIRMLAPPFTAAEVQYSENGTGADVLGTDFVNFVIAFGVEHRS